MYSQLVPPKQVDDQRNAWGQLGAFQDPILDDIYKYWNFRNSNPQRYGTQQFGTPCL